MDFRVERESSVPSTAPFSRKVASAPTSPSYTLIVLSTTDAGATLITCNREDFAEIGKHLAFKVIFW